MDILFSTMTISHIIYDYTKLTGILCQQQGIGTSLDQRYPFHMRNMSTIFQISFSHIRSNWNGFIGYVIIKSNQDDLSCGTQNFNKKSNSGKTCGSTAIFHHLPFLFGLQVHRKSQSLFGATEVNGPGCDEVDLSDVVSTFFLMLYAVILIKGCHILLFWWIVIFLLSILKGVIVSLFLVVWLAYLCNLVLLLYVCVTSQYCPLLL